VLLVVALVAWWIISAHCLAGELQPLTAVPVPADNPQTPEKIELGKKLFFDRRLSGDGTMNCAACHIPDMGFADGQAISLSYPTTKSWRNTQTIINSGFYPHLFHDGRATSLEHQALLPVSSSFEMNLNIEYLEEKLRVVPEYDEAFRKAFGGDITKERIAMALAAFERTIVSVNAPLDRYLRGDAAALGSDAKGGLVLFTGKAGCSKCHFGPHLADNKFHALLVPENPDVRNEPRMLATLRYVAKVSGYPDYKTLSEDLGRYLVTKDKKDWKAFRTHSLREISRTAPYMHNGVFKTLDEVIEFMDGGGGKGNTELKPLGLTADEKRQLKAFLTEALTGEEIRITYPDIP
jgi:cytochrome c peroxidase